MFFWVAASVSDAPVVNPNAIKTLSANGLITCPIKGSPVFSNGPESLPKIPPDSPILCNWVSDIFILAEEYLQKFYEVFKPVC